MNGFGLWIVALVLPIVPLGIVTVIWIVVTIAVRSLAAARGALD